MYVCVCAYARTRTLHYVRVSVCLRTDTHTACRVLGCKPRSRDETPGEPDESRLTKSPDTYMPYACSKYMRKHIYSSE